MKGSKEYTAGRRIPGLDILPVFLLLLCILISNAFSSADFDATSVIDGVSRHAAGTPVASIDGDDGQLKSGSVSFHARWLKFRKRHKYYNDYSSHLQPIEKELEMRHHVPVSTLRNYQAPHFLSEQHSFLYRLACF